MALGSSNIPLFLMIWCYLHYKFIVSYAKTLYQQNFVPMLQTNLTYSLLVIRLCNHGF